MFQAMQRQGVVPDVMTYNDVPSGQVCCKLCSQHPACVSAAASLSRCIRYPGGRRFPHDRPQTCQHLEICSFLRASPAFARYWTWSSDAAHENMCWLKSSREHRVPHVNFVSGRSSTSAAGARESPEQLQTIVRASGRMVL